MIDNKVLRGIFRSKREEVIKVEKKNVVMGFCEHDNELSGSIKDG
jgi:hypothetical protein